MGAELFRNGSCAIVALKTGNADTVEQCGGVQSIILRGDGFPFRGSQHTDDCSPHTWYQAADNHDGVVHAGAEKETNVGESWAAKLQKQKYHLVILLPIIIVMFLMGTI